MADLPEAAFRSGSFVIEMRGLAVTFPSVPASRWLEALSTRGWPVAVLQLMEADSYDRFLDSVSDERTGSDDLPRLARKAIAEAGGRPWWEVERLCSALYASGGRLLGAVLGAGADPGKVTLAVVCAAVWSQLAMGADAEAMLKLEASLTVPPPEAVGEDMGTDDMDPVAMVQQLRSLPGVRIG